MNKEDWRINIQNLARRVTLKYSNSVTLSVFKRYGASSFYDLDSIYYDEVFGDLMQIDEDD